ncbi:MAG: hypothetical protein ACM3UN_03220 [Bacillota bacterium]|jgi:uncharacterized protein YwgA
MSNIDKVIACLKYLEISPKIKDKKDYRGRFFTQKTAFLAKALGMNLTYSFTPYVAGPYSPDLACDYYANADKVESLNTNHRLSNQETDILDKIKNCSGIYDSMALMEATATTVYLKLQKPQLSDDDLFVELKRLKPHLTDSDKLIGITKSKALLFKAEYLTDDMKKEMDAWDNIE